MHFNGQPVSEGQRPLATGRHLDEGRYSLNRFLRSRSSLHDFFDSSGFVETSCDLPTPHGP